ncbi:MAG TPA: glycerate kinase, partial [Chloroflexi bacterium]|nr:glycerate kinase [Chloroflexota bacterium]
SSFGAGLLILDAIRSGAEPIFIGLGGSATVDGGTGAAAALGIRFYDQNGNPVTSGGSLQSIQSLDLSGLRELDYEGSLVFLTDVNNPLCGPNGAAFIFAPQKGADQKQVQQLEQGLKHLAKIIESETGLELQDRAGMGAAGGFALPFVAFMEASIRGGIDFVLDCLQFDQKLPGTDLVITGEGRTDAQSAMGKAISAVARRAKAQGVPTTVISGALTEGAKSLLDLGVTELIQATPVGQDLPTALANAELNLAAAAKAYFEKIKKGN